MKQTYIKPEVLVEKTELEEMIAASLELITDVPADPEKEALSREIFSLLDEFE